jgi:hypothetical protein
MWYIAMDEDLNPQIEGEEFKSWLFQPMIPKPLGLGKVA